MHVPKQGKCVRSLLPWSCCNRPHTAVRCIPASFAEAPIIRSLQFLCSSDRYESSVFILSYIYIGTIRISEVEIGVRCHMVRACLLLTRWLCTMCSIHHCTQQQLQHPNQQQAAEFAFLKSKKKSGVSVCLIYHEACAGSGVESTIPAFTAPLATNIRALQRGVISS